MSTRPPVPSQPTRMSTRQAQRRNTPKPPRPSETQGRWIIGGTKSDERKLLERIVEYLHVDPLHDGNPTVLRFLLKEWKQFQSTLHTTGTMDSLKQKLLDMNVPYLRRMQTTDLISQRTKWEYWSDYSLTGIATFHAANSGHKEHEVSDTTRAENNQQSGTTLDGSETDEASDTANEEDILHEDEASYQNPMKLIEHQSSESQTQSPPLMATMDPHGRLEPLRDSRPSTPGSIQDKAIATRQLPSSEEASRPRSEEASRTQQTPTTLLRDTEGNTIIDLQEMEWRNQRRRQETVQLSNVTRQLLGGQNDHTMTPTSLLQTFEGILTERIHDASNTLDTRQKVWKQNILELQRQVNEQEHALQERLRRHEHRVLKAETSLAEWEKMLLDHEERLEAKEKGMLTRLQEHEEAYLQRLGEMDTALEERQSERILADGSEWEDHIETKFEEYMQAAQQKLQQTTTDAYESLEQRLDEMANQREKRTKAWMEVAATQTLDNLSSSLQTFHAAQKADIDEFFEVSKLNLQQDLDEFQYHAQETLHEGIFGKDHPNPRARHAAPPSRAIAVESEEEHMEEITQEHPTAPPPADESTLPPARAHQAVTPQRHHRWKNVDMATFSPSNTRHGQPAVHQATGNGQHPTSDQTSATVDKERYDQAKPHLPPQHISAKSQATPRDAAVAQDQRTETAENYIARLRKTPTPMQLRGQQRQAVVTWYNSFVDFLKTYRVPIKIFDEFHVHKLDDPAEVLYPQALAHDPHMYDRYSAAIYARLEEDQVLDPDNQVYMGLLRLHNSTRDGYIVLKSILAATLLADIRNISVLSTPPTAAPGTDPFLYAASLKEFFSHQAQLERHYHHKEQATMYLQAMQQQPKYTAAATQMLQDLEQLKLANSQDLPAKYGLSQLPVAMVTHQGVLRSEPSMATLNVTQSTRPLEVPDNHPSEYRPTGTTRTPRTPTSRMRNSQGTGGAPRSRFPQQSRPEVQCVACSTNGHTVEVCKILPRVHSCMEYISGQPTQATESLQQYRKTNHPMTKRQNKERLLNVLLGEITSRQMQEGDGWWEDVRDIVDTVAETYHDEYYEDKVEYHTSIHRTEVYKHIEPDHLDGDILDGVVDLHRLIQPVQYPPQWELTEHDEGGIMELEEDEILAQDMAPTTVDMVLAPDMAPTMVDMVPPSNKATIDTTGVIPTQLLSTTADTTMADIGPGMLVEPRQITMITTRLDTRRDLADTGATISATGIRSILHRFQEDSDYEIKGYDGQVTKAAGQGYARIYNPTSKQVDEMLFVYTPLVMGTIISLEHHAKTHPRIHKWTQEATPSDDKGLITFYANDGTVVSEYPTIRSQGLYYIQDLNFIPAPSSPQSILVTDEAEHTPIDDAGTLKLNMLQGRAITFPELEGRVITPLELEDTDYTPDMESEHFPYLVGNQQTPATTLCVMATTPATDRAVKATHQYELWHQRLGHAPATRLYQTAQQVTGLPTISPTALPSFIRCRACDIAKLRKAPRGQPIEDPPALQTGQHFSMDLGFIRGPANLQAVLERREDTHPKIIHSRQGYTCYLLIMDRKSRYMWVFPLKSRSVSTDLMAIFLQTHGNSTATSRVIRTDGEGSLAESTNFRNLVAKERFVLQKTATDTSSQNGTAERPHQSLGNMVRCMLYAAAMPVEFWADALVYAVYVTNRLHHSGIDAIPYTVWTGKKTDVSHLRIFGAHVTVRRSGPRPTKLDPHFFTGRFLRFGATAKNILYFDDVTHRVKVARHCTMDELHYGTDPLRRPPMANTIIKQVVPHNSPPSLPETLLQTDEVAAQQQLDGMDHTPREGNATTAHTAVAAQLSTSIAEQKQQMERVLALSCTTNSFGPPTRITLPMNQLPTLGLILRDSPTHTTTTVIGCQEGTAASRLPRWRSQLQDATIRSVEDAPVRNKATFVGIVATLRQRRAPKVNIIVAKHEVPDLHSHDVPQLHYDQLRHINHVQNQMRRQHRTAKHKEANMVLIMSLTETITLTRSQLKKRQDYQKWRMAEWAQHNKYKTQNMFGVPIKRPPGATVLPFVWTYCIKMDPITGQPIFKARCTCNGGKRYGKAVTLAETYATCVAQPACRLFWAITASEGLISLGADAGNAFAEAPPPVEPFYMMVDAPFQEWWVECLGNQPIPPGYVLPVQHALQGHPESPRLWEVHIHNIMVNHLQFVPTTHEKCLYSKRDPTTNELQMLLRQVDDFSVSAKDVATCHATIAAVGQYLQVPLNDLGLIKKFNGVNIQQTRWFVKISCEEYILRILTDHEWTGLKASNLPVPMRNDPAYQKQLESAPRPTTDKEQQAIQRTAGFSYRMATGELIYAMVTARPEISFATTKLTQYGSSPALIHYQAVKHVYAFLNNTKEDGLIFWRREPRMDLPEISPPLPRSNPNDWLPTPPVCPTSPVAYSDSDWGSDTTHRRSVSGIIIMVSGAAVVYKTHYQRAVALSSTEAEFVSASDAGKLALYIRSLLTDLGFTQPQPTSLHIDNRGAMHMVTAGAPTKRTRHVDIRYFALLQWAETGQIKAEPVPTAHNVSDSMTKATGRIKFHQHADVYMGRRKPSYVSHSAGVLLPHTLALVQIHKRHDHCHPPCLHMYDMQEVSALRFPVFHRALRSSCFHGNTQSMGG